MEDERSEPAPDTSAPAEDEARGHPGVTIGILVVVLLTLLVYLGSRLLRG